MCSTFKVSFFTYLGILLLQPCELRAQGRDRFSVSVGATQIKEGFNGGMVFTGPQAEFRYSRRWDIGEYELSYNPKIALAVSFSRGMVGYGIGVTPIDVSCIRSVLKSGGHNLKIGLNVATNYDYQLYPDLQNGYLFWVSEIGASICLQYSYRWQGGELSILGRNSIFGFTSRPKQYDPYFYSIRFVDFVCYAHQDLTFGSFNNYNHTNLMVNYKPTGKHSFGIGVDYLATYYDIGMERLNYFLQWSVKI